MRNGHFILILAFLIFAGLAYIRERLSIEFHQYEDGSGEITWCLPWEGCN